MKLFPIGTPVLNVLPSGTKVPATVADHVTHLDGSVSYLLQEPPPFQWSRWACPPDKVVAA